ncbi:MAG: hypothetical protein J5806_14570 [Lentisphaeria bacterium]|nr:hypothetical protein [Lentisphaeria bacterium]
MAEFTTTCPYCNAKLQAQDEWIGMEVECPSCKRVFTVQKFQTYGQPGQNYQAYGQPGQNYQSFQQAGQNYQAYGQPGQNYQAYGQPGQNAVTDKEKSSILEIIIEGSIHLWQKISWTAVDKTLRPVIITIGSIMFLCFGLAASIGGIVLASKNEQPILILFGICIFLATVFLAYFGRQIFRVGDNSIKTNQNRISSDRLLNCFFIFLSFVALGVLIFGIWLAYDSKSIDPFYYTFTSAFSLFAFSIVALEPRLINLEVNEEASSDEDWISITLFFVKGNLFIAPYYWTLCLTILCINLLVHLGAEGQVLLQQFIQSISIMAAIGIMPLTVYLLFLGINFVLNLAKSLLSIPKKLDTIADKLGKK